MNNHVFLADDDVIQIIVVGDQTSESVQAMGREIIALVAQLRAGKKRVYIIDNLKRMGNSTADARREVSRLARELDFDKGAVVGDASPWMRYGTNLMLRAIGRPNLKYFASLDGAYAWFGLEPAGNYT